MPRTTNQWLVATLTLIVISLGTWGLTSVPALSERTAVVETRVKAIEKYQDKVDKKLDEILDRLPPRHNRGD
jgi:hypothetical protein